ncbi:MAG: Crp/Fnr family transcriptional regulator, partial [Actinobacteria bacterium]|nr:Crp/Fnr family transcriptional regulator [Actinomycetota bacterium]
EISKAMLVTFSALLREAIERAYDFVFLDLKGRVAKILLEFAGDLGKPAPDGTIIELDLHQADVAAMVGGSRQAINKILKDMENRGLLRLEGRTIVLNQPEQLKHRAGL